MKNKVHHISILLLLALSGCGESNDPFLQASIDSTIYSAKQMDRANETEFYRGHDFYDYLQYELETCSREGELSSRRDKLSMMLEHVDSIETSCSTLISLIEEIKIDLLKQEAENVTKVKNNDPNILLWRKYNPVRGCLPSSMNLHAVTRPKTSDVVTLEMVGDSDNQPSGKGQRLWNSLIAYRRSIIKHTGSYNWGESEFNIDVKAFNQFSDRENLLSKVSSMVDASKANLKEDRQVLIDLYMMLTKPEFIEKNGTKIHWVNSMFKNAPLVSAISSLSTLQNEILQARSLAYMHWQSKCGHCCYGFNEIMPIATGPSNIKEGEDVEIKVSIVAFDSDKQPFVTIEGYKSQIKYNDGLGIVTIKPKKGLQTIRGTVSIKTNSGLARTEPWEWTVNVIEK